MRTVASRSRPNVRTRDLFRPDEVEIAPHLVQHEIMLPGSPPSPVYDGPIPELARVDRVAARPVAQRRSVMPRRTIEFGTAPSSPLSEIVIASRIATDGWSSGQLVVRMHAVTSFPASTRVYVRVQDVSYSARQPELTFVNPASIASVTYNSTLTVPRLLLDNFVPGAHVRVVLQLECTTSSPVGIARFAMSIGLVGHA